MVETSCQKVTLSSSKLLEFWTSVRFVESHEVNLLVTKLQQNMGNFPAITLVKPVVSQNED